MTTAASNPSPVGVLILVWLLTRPKAKGGRGTRSELGKALKPYLELQWSDGEQRSALEGEIEALEREEQIARGKGRARGSFSITEGGRRAALSALKVTSLPGKLTWRTVKTDLPALVLGLPPSAGNAKPGIERMRAAVLALLFQLDTKDLPTLKAVGEALVWRELGVKTRERLTGAAVLRLFVNRVLGTAKSLDPEKALEQRANQAVGARRGKADEFQAAILRRWIAGLEIAPAAKPRADAAPAPNPPKVVEPLDDDAFATRVLDAARASKTGRFGDNKVFISHVFRKLLQEGAVADDADAFKGRLVSAHRNGLLSLSRADLVEAMNPEDVESSEARYLSASFHFVRI